MKGHEICYETNQEKKPSNAPFMGFPKWWYPRTIGFPTKNDHFGVFWGYHHLRKHPCLQKPGKNRPRDVQPVCPTNPTCGCPIFDTDLNLDQFGVRIIGVIDKLNLFLLVCLSVCLFGWLVVCLSGQITIIPKPKLSGHFGGIPLQSPPFGVTSAGKVAIICPGLFFST